MELTHFDDNGNARMVDVADKAITHRSALATGKIYVNRDVFEAIQGKRVKKGDVLTVATTAGIMACKRTSELIPMCHPISLTHASVSFEMNEAELSVTALCRAQTDGKTGVEMEALQGVSTALLTIYDMCKAIDKRMRIDDIHLCEKTGGKSGDFVYMETRKGERL